MTTSVAIEDFTTRLRQLTDIENAANRFPDAEIQDYLKTAHRKWLDFLFNNNGSHLLEIVNSATNTVAGTATINKPGSNPYRIIGVDAVVGGVTRTLRPLPHGERNRFNSDTLTWQSQRQLYYRLELTSIRLFPTPDAAYNVIVYYVNSGNLDFTGSGFVDGYNGWEEYIVLEAALMVLDKDNRRKEHIERRLADLKDSIISSVRGIDDGEPQVVTDVGYQSYERLYPWC